MPISTRHLFTKQPRALVSVINDLVSDQRLLKTCACLRDAGFDVVIFGRKDDHSPPLPDWPYEAVRLNKVVAKGPLTYLIFNFRLFFRLLFMRADLLVANDLDTLLPNRLCAWIKRIPLIYDSHELFCEVPELIDSPTKRRIWQKLERWLVPGLRYCITVNESIAAYFHDRYGNDFKVVRNIGVYGPAGQNADRRALGLPVDKKIIILQGAGINVDRGAEELVEAMKHVDNVLLLIIGSGDVWNKLEEMTKQPELRGRILMMKRVPREKLLAYTACADLGLSVDKDTNLNYRFSLPNKLFDYIHAGIPILASRLPEIEKVISRYNIGYFITSHDPRQLANDIQNALSQNDPQMKQRLQKAAEELTWTNERRVLMEVILSAKEENVRP